ncbi:MAG: carbohydrate kinase family protein [Candidatus Methanomethylicaceae archaeon]
MLDLLSIGNINIDLSFYISGMPEPDGEVLGDLGIYHGGAAANFAVGASRLGLKVGLLACIGDDQFGRDAIKELERERVDTSYVKTVKGAKTGIVCILVEKSGARRMIAHRGANTYLEGALGDLPEVKFLQLCNVNKKVLMKVKGASLGRSKITLDPGGGVIEFVPEDLKGIEVLLLNELECKLLTGLDYKEGAKWLSKYVKFVVVKMGDRGAYLFDGKGGVIHEALKVNVVDTTGAGDAFDAGFMAALVNGMSKMDCLRWGIATASMKIQKRGAREGLPTLKELREFLSGIMPN